MKPIIYGLFFTTLLSQLIPTTSADECSSFDHAIDQEYQECRDQGYGFNACHAQSWSIRHACRGLHNHSEEQSVHDCRVGRLISKDKKFKFENEITPTALENMINDPALLSKVLDAQVTPTKTPGIMQSHKGIWTPIKAVNVNNRLRIKKIDDYTFKLIGDNYDNIFVYNEVTIKLENDDSSGSSISIKSSTYLKQSAIDKVKYIPGVLNTLINGAMNDTFKRLKKEIKERI